MSEIEAPYGDPSPIEWIAAVQGRRVIAAVSGGADSVYMLHELVERGNCHEIIVGHVNHGTRGRESDDDEAFVQRLAETLGLRFAARTLALEELLTDENSLRTARLRALKQMAREHDADTIAFGHNRDDVAEWVLIARMRKAGLAGIGSMRPLRVLPGGIRLVRPVLDIPRAHIRESLRERGVRWREDRTNESDRYLRNRLRHTVIPELMAQPGEYEALIEAARDAAQRDDAHRSLAEILVREAEIHSNRSAILIDVEKLRADDDPEVQLHALRMFRARFGADDWETPPWPNRSVTHDILRRIDSTTGDEATFDLPQGVQLIVGNRYAVMHTLPDALSAWRSVSAGFPFYLWGAQGLGYRQGNVYARNGWRIDTSYCVFHKEYLAKERVAFFDLKVEGDLKIRCLDQDDLVHVGKCLYKGAWRILQEAGVPVVLRDDVLAVYADISVAWIPGIRRGMSARATPSWTSVRMEVVRL